MPSIEQLRELMEAHALAHDVGVHSIILDDQIAAQLAVAEQAVNLIQIKMTTAAKAPKADGTDANGTTKLDGDQPDQSLAERLESAKKLVDDLKDEARPHTVDVVFRRLPVAEWLKIHSPRFERIQKIRDDDDSKSGKLYDWLADVAAKSFAELRVGGETVDGGTLDDILPRLREADVAELIVMLRTLNGAPVGRGPLAPGGFKPAAN
jgi:hypothetical protein